jgi:FixJ family two-component response regulator
METRPATVPATVYVIDDDASLRAALDTLFRSTGLSARLFETASGFLEKPPATEGPACIVVDVRMPGLSGLDFQDRLKEAGMDIPVILMTGYGDIPMSVRGMKAGAINFLTKPFRDQEMLDAVSEALARHAEQQVGAGQVEALRQRFESLTPRERQVMEGVVLGRMNKQVAGDLRLSEITVKIHRGTLMRKMEARSLADLVRMAMLLGLPTGAS